MMTIFRGAFVFLIIALGIFYFNSPDFNSFEFFPDTNEVQEETEEKIIILEEVESDTDEALMVIDEPLTVAIEEIQKISTPEPLQVSQIDSGSTLTINGVIGWTNFWRLDESLNILDRSLVLDSIAAAKLADMFENQYFAHASPVTGDQVGELADEFGYEYVFVGENLALGNFDDDETLVQAWMNSPGHRANMLKENYTEIGVAVGKGMFEGRKTWLAVQAFGTPLSICKAVNLTLKIEIDNLADEIEDSKIILNDSLEELESTSRSNPSYNDIVNAYNKLVSEYNLLLADLKSVIKTYNNQINVFNNCVGKL